MYTVTVDVYKTYRTTVKVSVEAPDLETAKEMVHQDGVEAYSVVDEEPTQFWEERQEVK